MKMDLAPFGNKLFIYLNLLASGLDLAFDIVTLSEMKQNWNNLLHFHSADLIQQHFDNNSQKFKDKNTHPSILICITFGKDVHVWGSKSL